jgi:hypothetical protein
MDAATRQLVRDRAKSRCEYCGLPQVAAPAISFHVEHIRARQHAGDDVPENLALACPDCNRHKGPNLSGVNPETRQVVLLFNPRTDSWHDHFEMLDARIIGLTPTGNATAHTLRMNVDERVRMREELLANGEM